MYIEMLNFWYFFWLILSAGAIVGLYFLLRNKSAFTQKAVLFGLLAVGLLLHFLKVYIPPYSVDEARMLRDSWFVNICGAKFTRKAKKIVLPEGIVELALDQGVLFGGGRETPLCEVEIELKSGDRNVCDRFASALVQQYNLTEERKSKFRRALALYKGE